MTEKELVDFIKSLTQDIKEDNDKAEEKENARQFVRSVFSNTIRTTGDNE